jgi:hypothetical protein
MACWPAVGPSTSVRSGWPAPRICATNLPFWEDAHGTGPRAQPAAPSPLPWRPAATTACPRSPAHARRPAARAPTSAARRGHLEPTPREIFGGSSPGYAAAEKLRRWRYDVDRVVCCASTWAAASVRELRGGCWRSGAAHGGRTRLSLRGAATAASLRAAVTLGFTVESAALRTRRRVSSSRFVPLKPASRGDELLGRPYRIANSVRPGRRLGRRFPTANLPLHQRCPLWGIAMAGSWSGPRRSRSRASARDRARRHSPCSRCTVRFRSRPLRLHRLDVISPACVTSTFDSLEALVSRCMGRGAARAGLVAIFGQFLNSDPRRPPAPCRLQDDRQPAVDGLPDEG